MDIRFNPRKQAMEPLPSRIVCLKCRKWVKRGTDKAKGWALERCPACLAKENPPGRMTYMEVSMPIMMRTPRYSAVIYIGDE